MGAEILKDFLARLGFQVDEAGAQKFSRSLASASLRAAAFGTAIQAAAASLYYGLYRMAESQSQILALSEATGVAVDRIEELNYIAGQCDATAQALQSSLRGLQAAMAGATIGQGGLSTFHRLGIRVKDANGHLRDTAELLFEVGQKIKGMDRGRQEMFLSQLGIDRSLVKMLTTDVSGLSDAYREMYAAAGTDATRAAEASRGYLNEIKSITTVLSMLARSVSMAFVTRMRDDMIRLRKGVVENFKKISEVFQLVVKIAMNLASIFGTLTLRLLQWAGGILGWFSRVDTGTQKILLGVLGLVAAWRLLNLSFLATPLGILLSLVAAIVALVDDFQTWREGGESFINWSEWAPGILTALDFLSRLKVTLGLVAGAFVAWMVIPGIISGVSAAISALGAVMAAVASANPLGLIAMGLVLAAGLVIDNWETVKGWFDSFVTWLSDKFAWLSDAAKAVGSFFGGGDAGASGPVLGPTPAAAAAAAGGSSPTTISQNTTINVEGASSPEATARSVGRQQGRVNADLVRHARGAAR